MATDPADCMAEDTGMSGILGALATKVDFKLSLLKDVMTEYTEIKRVINGLAEEKVRLQQEKERLQHEKEILQHEQQCQFHMNVKFCFKK